MGLLGDLFGLLDNSGAFDDDAALGGINVRPGRRKRWRPAHRSVEVKRLPRKLARTSAPPTKIVPRTFKPAVVVSPSTGKPIATVTVAPGPKPIAVVQTPQGTIKAPIVTTPAGAPAAAIRTSTGIKLFGLSGLGDALFDATHPDAASGDQAASDPSTTDTGDDTGYTPNGKLWRTQHTYPILWEAGGQVQWPDGTPMVGTIWLPASIKATDIDGGLDARYQRRQVWTGRVFDKISDRSQQYIDPAERQGLLDLLTSPALQGFRWLGANLGGVGDARAEDLIVAILQEGNSVDRLASFFRAVLLGTPIGDAWADKLSGWGWKPQEAYPPGYGPQSIMRVTGGGYDVGDATTQIQGTFTVSNAWDWGALDKDPTTQAYPYLFDRFGVRDFPLWGVPNDCDFWRTDGAPITAGASLMPDGPLACIEFLDALVTGEHGVPVIVDSQGNLLPDGLGKLVDLYPQLSQLDKRGILLATIYDTTHKAPLGFASGDRYARNRIKASLPPPPDFSTPTPADAAPAADQIPAASGDGLSPANGAGVLPGAGPSYSDAGGQDPLSLSRGGATGYDPYGGGGIPLPSASDVQFYDDTPQPQDVPDGGGFSYADESQDFGTSYESEDFADYGADVEPAATDDEGF